MLSQLNVPSAIIVGAGASKEVATQAKRLGTSRALLVTDEYLSQCGLAREVADLLDGEGIATTTFGNVQPDPTDANVLDGLAQLRDSNADLVVGLGGGSSMDAAKVISIMANNEPPISQYAGYHNIPNPGVPLIVIPTTAGTGSEVTKVAVIGDTERDVKMMMLDVNLLPTVALVDYELTLTMPAALTAHVGVDTLVHAIEAYVSKKASGLTDPIALSSIRLIAGNLLDAVREPDNRAARAAMMLAACQGGMAFANSSVCLVHGMSRPIGALYHVPHGLSNATLLPAVTEFSVPGAPARYASVARAMGYATDADADEHACRALVAGLKELNRAVNVPSLRDCTKVSLEVFDQRVEKMASDAIASGSPNNNPVVPDQAQIVELYHQAW